MTRVRNGAGSGSGSLPGLVTPPVDGSGAGVEAGTPTLSDFLVEISTLLGAGRDKNDLFPSFLEFFSNSGRFGSDLPPWDGRLLLRD